MTGIIKDDERDKHDISPFLFGELNLYGENDDFQPFIPKEVGKSVESKQEVSEKKSSEKESKRDEIITALLDKGDILTSEIQNLQNKLSNQEMLFQNELEKMKREEYERGARDGLSHAKGEAQEEYRTSLNHLSNSIQKLEELGKSFSSMMQSVEKELVHTSVAIAKEVITNEITYNSGQVAINLTKSLLKNLSEAKDITIHVNSSDLEIVKNGLSDISNLKVISDIAVSQGGVIIVSDVGTIEGTIMERLRIVKNDILSKI
jgi:flagellar assembly protein FliH